MLQENLIQIAQGQLGREVRLKKNNLSLVFYFEVGEMCKEVREYWEYIIHNKSLKMWVEFLSLNLSSLRLLSE